MYQNWTIHGIWPSKRKHSPPIYCNTSVGFDYDRILPIIEDLTLEWTNDHANTGPNRTLWQHEWFKRGSCSVTLDALGDEFKYFSKGKFSIRLHPSSLHPGHSSLLVSTRLNPFPPVSTCSNLFKLMACSLFSALEWHQKFDLFRYLANFGILPGGVYPIHEIFAAVKLGLGGLVNPSLECRNFASFEETVLTQIGICFNKKLELIDCDDMYPNGLWGTCPKSGSVLYPKDQKSYKAVEKASKSLTYTSACAPVSNCAPFFFSGIILTIMLSVLLVVWLLHFVRLAIRSRRQVPSSASSSGIIDENSANDPLLTINE